MSGDEQRRHCSSCARDVLHLSAMTAEAARAALLARRGERVCVRYSCDAEDNLLFVAPRSGSLRAVALASALAACDAGGPGEDVGVATTEICAVEEPVLVDDRGGPVIVAAEPVRAAEPGPQELPGVVVDVVVVSPVRSDGTAVTRVSMSSVMGIPATVGVGVAASDLVVATATIAGAVPEPAPPRRVRPIESQLGALGLPIEGLPGDEDPQKRGF